jgi:hypothetical protein
MSNKGMYFDPRQDGARYKKYMKRRQILASLGLVLALMCPTNPKNLGADPADCLLFVVQTYTRLRSEKKATRQHFAAISGTKYQKVYADISSAIV